MDKKSLERNLFRFIRDIYRPFNHTLFIAKRILAYIFGIRKKDITFFNSGGADMIAIFSSVLPQHKTAFVSPPIFHRPHRLLP
jgi:hypothetical protein